MRDRVARVVRAVNANQVVVSGGGRFLAGFSKPKSEGSHAAHVRRRIRALDPAKEADLEPQYPTGSMWRGDFKLSSAVIAAELHGEGDAANALLEIWNA